MKRKQRKSRFINLAEHLTLQNEIVGSTMDSLLKFVSESDLIESRSDFQQIKRTARQNEELNPCIGAVENYRTDFAGSEPGSVS